ncbi:hypothetical protein [Rubinisphaera italica]|uniref:Glycosyltransferase 2-like domain-containing protein n=1 Tax=Rubinisphaera italica TaxID=2527969 RepID=A0A5C5XBJ1_9PLAN|nr:hypothetical protein [Rubinisphaera italica]TWT59781.1 hypothetical protein Pan54_04910 [Rubinisphaera italica]
MDANKDCVILVPVGHRIEPDCEVALRELEEFGYPVRRTYGYAAIDQARNQMASDALRDGFQELMWIDADVGFEPTDVARLRNHELPFCCGLYPKKGRRAFACNVMPGTESIQFGANGGLCELRHVGFGFVHTRREVYNQILKTFALPVCNTIYNESVQPFFLPMIIPEGSHHTYLAEDYAFCERTRQANISIIADTTVRLRHIGSYPYSWEEAGRDPERFADYTFRINEPR